MASIDNSAWDASKAWANGAASDDPASFYDAICAGKKAGDPKTQGAHALPYRYTPSSNPNADGVRNALARLSSTEGLTNAAEAKSKLEGLMKMIQSAEGKSAKSSGPKSVRAFRAARAQEIPGGQGRMSAFPAELRSSIVQRDGKTFLQVDGYATVFNRGYQMWDEAGPYTEVAGSHMLDRSLAMSPDVAFLTNHKGVTMARTTNGSLTLTKDDHGLAITALLNMDRQDVRDLASALNDKLITEMSFAFMIDNGSWDDDFTTYTLNQVNINRGDVSAVNYGANPYTSIGARSQTFMREVINMPVSVKRAAMGVLLAGNDPHMIRSAAAALDQAARARYDQASRSLADLAGVDVSSWDIQDLTGEGEDASTGEFARNDSEPDESRAMPEDPSTDPIDSVEAESVPGHLGDLDDDDDSPELNGTDDDEARAANAASMRRLRAMSLSDDDIPAELSAGDETSEETRALPTPIDLVSMYANRWELLSDDSV